MNVLNPVDIRKYVTNCSSLAALLEVSAYPKPGNVHRYSDGFTTNYEQFLAGSVSIGSVMGHLAEKSSKKEYIGLGKSINNAVDEMFKWQKGGNTHLGIILLFTPISAGAGVALSRGPLDLIELREDIKNIIKKSQSKDSIHIYDAINKAMSQENLGSSNKLDITNSKSIETIKKDNITPLEIFEICSKKDSICKEWVTGFNIVFEQGYPFLNEKLSRGAGINNATVDTFLKILSENPDTLIIRKSGKKNADQVSQKAKQILEIGGTQSEEGINKLWTLDKELRKKKGRLNPGTTADLTAATLFVLCLSGWKP